MQSTVFKRGRLPGKLRGISAPAADASIVVAAIALAGYLIYLAHKEAEDHKRKHPDIYPRR